MEPLKITYFLFYNSKSCWTHSGARSEEDGWRKQHQHTYTTMWKEITGEKLLYDTGSTSGYSVMTDRRGVEGRGERLWREGIYL